MSVSSAIEPLRVRHFRLLWSVSIFSNLGSFFQSVAASWLMLELTGSPLWVGLMVASTTLPLLFLALPAGALADVAERRLVILGSQVVMGGSALAMAVLWYLDALGPGVLLALGLLLGVGLAFNAPAWQALVPDLVPRGLVASAVALNSAAFNAARAVGPALGGLIVATAGPGPAFLINAASYVGVIGVLAAVELAAPGRSEGPSITNAIALGVRYTRFTAPFRWLLFTATAFALTSAAVQALLPNLTEILGGGSLEYGALLGAMGAGALVGAFTRSAIGERLRGATIQLSIAGYGLAGVAVGGVGSVWLAAAALAVAGLFWVWTLSTLNATTQLLSPAWVRGRVMSLYLLAFSGFYPIGSIIAGALGDAAGVRAAMIGLSTGAVVFGIGALRLPIPMLGHGESPEPVDFEVADHPDRVAGSPVMVLNTWVIDEDDLERFLDVMSRMRLVRLRTGAFRWRLYRNAGDAHRMTEVYLLDSWDDHLRQHQRIDQAAASLITEARGLDRAGGPVSRHLVAVDVIDPEDRPAWDELLAHHDRLHAVDGSIPIDE